jgi:hypothetical protein
VVGSELGVDGGLVGEMVGVELGLDDGIALGRNDGCSDGTIEGWDDGTVLGGKDGSSLSSSLVKRNDISTPERLISNILFVVL